MPRQARDYSPTGFYHVMVRGVAQMAIFLDDSDRRRYLDTLLRFKRKREYKLFAYCLMKNHVHLLIKAEKESLSLSMKRIGVSFTKYFNHKYQRVGHVFQDRFRSQIIESEAQFMCCARYIHNNPVKALLTDDPAKFPWSSYPGYLSIGDPSPLVDMAMLLSSFSKDSSQAIEQLASFMRQVNTDQFIDWDDNIKVRGQELVSEVTKIIAAHGLDLASIHKTDRISRDIAIKVIKRSINCTNVELANVLGLSKDIVFRA